MNLKMPPPLSCSKKDYLKYFLFFISLSSLLFLSSCQKNVEPEETLVTESLPKTLMNKESASPPEIVNGVLKFKNFISFENFDITTFKSNPSSNLRTGSTFKSMQSAFDDLTNDEATIAAQLAVQYPNGPASIYDNTHSNLANTYPNSYIIVGNNQTGYYYDINSFDRNITDQVDVDGIVIIGDFIIQYTKNLYKYWKNGDINNLSTLKNATTSQGVDLTVVDVKNPQSIALAQQNASRAPQYLPNIFWNRDCQNTKNGKRVLGYLDYQNYKWNQAYYNIGFNFYKTAYYSTSRSLQARLWGLWWDNWNTGHKQQANIVANSTNAILYYNNTNLPFPSTGIVNWNDNFDVVANNLTTWVIREPDPYHITPFYGVGPTSANPFMYTYTIPNSTTHKATFLVATGSPITIENPNCSCNK